jgi:hypothetical protein
VTVLANVVNVPWDRPYRGALYFVNAHSDQETSVERVPLGSGDPLTLLPHVPLDNPPGIGVDISDRGLFWIQEHRLLRLVIESFGDRSSPAQGVAGGPCFGDLACNAGLSCVDALCE